MKKTSNAIRIAAALAIATTMSTCVVAGTLAKYTTNGSSGDSARVAKWGVTVASASGSAFATSYTESGAMQASVASSNGDKVIAPGTSGTLPGTTVTGTPEVAVAVTHTATVTTTGNWGTDYLPIKVKVGSGDDASYVTGTSASDLTSKINTELAKSNKTFIAAGTNLANDGAPSLSWEWAYAGNDDGKDTTAGNQATAPTISISVSTTVTQVD